MSFSTDLQMTFFTVLRWCYVNCIICFSIIFQLLILVPLPFHRCATICLPLLLLPQPIPCCTHPFVFQLRLATLCYQVCDVCDVCSVCNALLSSTRAAGFHNVFNFVFRYGLPPAHTGAAPWHHVSCLFCFNRLLTCFWCCEHARLAHMLFNTSLLASVFLFLRRPFFF